MTAHNRRRSRTIPTVTAWLLLTSILTGCEGGSEAAGSSEPRASRAPSTGPSGDPNPDASSSSTQALPPPGWDGALRTDQESLPRLAENEGRADGNDAAVAWIDIRRVSATGRPQWHIVLRKTPPLASTLDPERRVMEHGVVLDSDGDRRADCQIGISTDAPTPGDFRVWVTDLGTGVTVEQIGPPYGLPIEFYHPASSEDLGTGSITRTVGFWFLGYGSRTPRCEIGKGAAFYAYAVVMDRGRDPEWDYAPDAAWLKIR